MYILRELRTTQKIVQSVLSSIDGIANRILSSDPEVLEWPASSISDDQTQRFFATASHKIV